MSSPTAPSGAAPPRVSVLMAVYNTVRYLPDALRSISSQSFTDFELLVIDDGSNDGSSEWLRSYRALEPRMKLVSRENRGLVPTRNELLHAAQGELVAWMDSDDIAAPGRLAAQVQRFDADSELVCLGCSVQCIDPDGNCLSIDRFPLSHAEIVVEQQKGGAIKFPTTMMRREVALAVGGFRGSFKIGEDFDLLLRMSEVGKMENLADTLYSYRQHLASACATLALSWPAYRDEILSLARERREVLAAAEQLDDGERDVGEAQGIGRAALQ